MADSYSLKRKNNTREIHIHKGEFKTENTCSSAVWSICQKSDKNYSTAIPSSTCLTENQARTKSASLGREVCGICVSSLYANYEV